MQLVIDNKNVYVVSDIHNDADGFKKLLKKIDFSKEDILIINGDIFDRGIKPVELYFEILKHDNIYLIQGNHDVWVRREIRHKYENKKVGEYLSYNTVSLMEEKLTPVDLLHLADWMETKPYFIELCLNGNYYQIAHAQTYPTPNRVKDMSWLYFGDSHYEFFIRGMEEYVKGTSIVGHRPTASHKIWKSHSGRTICIDCGNAYKFRGAKGALGALRLNDMKEYYVTSEEN